MISLKAIQTAFTPNHGPFPERESFRKRRLFFSLCKSNSSDKSDQETPPPEGDRRKQELLARIAMLQSQKVRLTDYLDERSAYLTQFAEEASAEIDQIGENALKELDEAGARVCFNFFFPVNFEESVELNKLQIEESEKKVVDFEGQIEKDRNEGLFFKNLALMGLVVIGIADASISSTSDWRKVALLGVILSYLGELPPSASNVPENIRIRTQPNADQWYLF